MEVTEESLKEEKCFWYLLLHKWVGKWAILKLSEDEIEDNTDINNKFQEWTMIERCEEDASRDNMGLQKSPPGDAG